MRCPKCGFISFDHLATCLNCSKDISEISSAAQGTTYNVTAPLFLKFAKSGEPKEYAVRNKTVSDNLAGHLDVVDPDLDILIDEEEGIEFDSDDLDMSLKDEFGGSDDGKDLNISLQEKGFDAKSGDNDLAVDLSQFEDMTPDDDINEVPEEKFTMNLPDDLADISDLAPPTPPQKQRPAAQENRSLDDGMDFDMLDMDLKLDGIDTGFSLTSPDKGGREEGIGGLSLDDIDLSSPLEKGKSAPPAPKPALAVKSGEMDMDADLDFELDLGGLSIPKK